MRGASALSTGAMAALAYLLVFQRSGTSMTVWTVLIALWVIPPSLVAILERTGH